jgi:mannose-6-phosphate isomerase-like protein (cupin superfamily)
MRASLPSLLLLLLLPAVCAAQAPTPAPTKPRQRPAPAASTATATMTVTVTDPTGSPIPGVRISATGPAPRKGETGDDGRVRFNLMRGGEYRLRFERDGFTTFERDVVMKAGAPLDVDVTLTPAPPPPKPEPVPVPSVTAPPGDPNSLSVVDFVEKNFNTRDPKRVDKVGCTASARTTIVQLREPVPEHASNDADEVIYVVAGEGTLRLGNRDVPLAATTMAVVPRGTAYGITRKGRNPLIYVSVVSGVPCTR